MIRSVNHITLAVRDIDQSFAFYRDLLGLKPLVKWAKGAYFLIDDLWFCLNLDNKREPNPCYTHYAFTVAPEDFAPMRQRLTDAGTFIFKENNSPGNSLYFLDPNGHKLEIHTGHWKQRLHYKKDNPGSWEKVEWFV